VRAEFAKSLTAASEMIALAERHKNWGFFLNAHMAAGLSHFYSGHLAKARDHLEHAGSEYDAQRFQRDGVAYGWDPGIGVACYDAMALRLLGYPDQAEEKARRALEIAHFLESPFHPALANGMLAMYYAYCRDVDRTLATAETAITLSKDNGFGHWLAVGTLLKGWSTGIRGHAEGLMTTIDGLTRWRATGASMLVPTFLMLKAEVLARAGRHSQSIDAIDEAIGLSRTTRESCYDAELFRTKAELLLKRRAGLPTSTGLKSAEKLLHDAIKITQSQKAKLLELRATVSLARLWQASNRRTEARKRLARIYLWFKEGFDTSDLQQAKALLDELADG
jgi:predicted ATPase